jgi:signal transduction histidine kinase
MKTPLHILHLEDDLDDAALIEATLAAAGIACATTRVESRAEFVSALERGGFDLILSDCTLPAFNGMAALKIAHDKWPDVPLVFVSGTLGEEQAIESLKSGATDYVLKGRLARLVPAVRRAMQEVEDRADCRQMEAQFIQSQKMEVIGHLAGGVAHDFNNILAVIMGYSDLTLEKLGPDDDLRSNLETIRSAAERAAGLTRQLLIFSRRQKVQLVVLDLNDVLKGLDNMLRRLIDENIEMAIVPGKDLGWIKADSGYIGQVLMNLVVNARDAMPNGGKLSIATRNVTLDRTYASRHTGAIAGDFVMLSVSDTGTGLSEEAKARLFEAFFTTKPEGKGTGLGLATCHAIVQQSGGYIDVYSEAGHGTSFKIYFPRVQQPREVAAGPIKAGPSLPRGTETLLLVEDEPAVRHLACDVLEAQGYHVLRASNGQEGLRATREPKGQPIDIVITDVIMPVMGGKAMVDWLKTSYPDLKVLFTSGYTGDAVTGWGMLTPGADFLPKPFTPATLVRKVRQMLDAPVPPIKSNGK